MEEVAFACTNYDLVAQIQVGRPIDQNTGPNQRIQTVQTEMEIMYKLSKPNKCVLSNVTDRDNNSILSAFGQLEVQIVQTLTGQCEAHIC